MNLLPSCVVLATFVCVTTSVFGREVKCKAGTFRGMDDLASFKGVERPYTKYLGIPYGESPTGQRRFKKPVAKAYIRETFDATYMRPACPQLRFPNQEPLELDEDCLRLNIYVPLSDARDKSKKLPVMIWIHGGAFLTGSSHQYPADVLSTFSDVIVVVINYRVAVFGFLSTNDDFSSGNYGLWDQHFAIKWVNENIEDFGGNKSQVTIFGESAGGASVVYQALYPGNHGRIHRVIAESGSALMSICYNNAPNATEFLAAVGCNKKSSEEVLSCMREADIDSLTAALNDPSNIGALVAANFNPSLDGEFIRKSPEELFKDLNSKEMESFSSLDFMSGVTDMEGATILFSLWPVVTNVTDVNTYNVSRKVYENVIIPMVVRGSFVGRDVPDAVIDAFVYQYTDWSDPDNYETTRQQLLQLSGDYPFLIPAIKTADAYSSLTTFSGNNYFYEFSVIPSMDVIWSVPSWMTGSAHSNDVPYVFGFSEGLRKVWNISTPETLDLEVAEYVMTYWANFAKSGNPNEPRKVPVMWPKYSKTNREYLNMASELTSASVKSRIGEPRTSFWLNLVPSLMNCKKSDAKKMGETAAELPIKDEL